VALDRANDLLRQTGRLEDRLAVLGVAGGVLLLVEVVEQAG